MSSIKGAIPLHAAKTIASKAPPTGSAPKGVQPKRSTLVQRVPAEYRETLLAASATASLLRPIPQPFHGVPQSSSNPLSTDEKKEAIEQQTNPLVHPDQTELKKKTKKKASSKQPLIEAPVVSSSSSSTTPLRLVQRTDNMIERNRSDVLNFDVEEDLDKIDPIFKEYRIRQDQIESKNPYELDREVFTPINRRSFYRFIKDTYKPFKIEVKEKGPIDENACQAIEESKRKGTVEAFSYQRFIKEYIRQASPYRGLLVYHGLGSGKTCSAIAAAEAIYGNSNKKIIVMTPFSLRPNFINEITFCGFKHFNVNNHWVRQPISTEYESAPVYYFAQEILSIPEEYLNAVMRRPEEERQVIWIPDFDKPSNYYDESQISPQERNDIRQQIMASIENRITFISYNGITAAKLKEYACSEDENGKHFFDDAVIVIDEFHNLIRLMQGNIEPYIRKRAGRKRKIAVEPIVPGRWKPSLCDRPLNYKRAYLFYRLLSDARNSKIIALSGTPIINFPEELGILANVLGGYMECVEFYIDTTVDDDLEEIRNICEKEIRVDIVRYEKMKLKSKFLVSVFQEGYVREETEDSKGEPYVGVRYTEDEDEGQETIQEVYPRIKKAIEDEERFGTIQEETFVSYPRLPIDDETFRKEFINPIDLSIRNRLVLQKRITGLISYYAASNEAFMPRVTKDELVRCEMSDYVLNMYTQARRVEIEGEANKKKEPGDIFSAVEMFAKMKNPSSYRFRSRALCNFAFPKSIERPFPGSKVEEEEAEEEIIGEAQLQEIIEQSSADVENDQKIVEEVIHEEEQIEDPDEVDPSEPVATPSVAAPSVAAPDEQKQEGGVGEEKEEAKPIVPATKKPLTASQARARLEALRAAKTSLAAVEASATPSSSAAPSAPITIKKDFSQPSDEENPSSKPKIVGIKKPVSSVKSVEAPDSITQDPTKPTSSRIISIKEAKKGVSIPVIEEKQEEEEEDEEQEIPPEVISSMMALMQKKLEELQESEAAEASSSSATQPKKIVGIKGIKKPSSILEPVSEPAQEPEPAVSATKKSVGIKGIKKPAYSGIERLDKPESVQEPAVSGTKKKLVGIKKPAYSGIERLDKPEPVQEPEPEPEPAVSATKKSVGIKGIKKPAYSGIERLDKPEPVQEPAVSGTKKKLVGIKKPAYSGIERLEEREPEPELGVESEVPARRYIPYKDLIRMAMDKLNKNRDLFLKLDAINEEGRLSNYSNKLDRMLRNLSESKGSNLVYSQFKTVEGLGVLGLALKANGYSEIVVQGSDLDPEFSPETIVSFEKGPQSGEKRFILFTGEGSKDRRALILNIFNGNIEKLPTKIQKVLVDAKFDKDQNRYGAICWVIGITGAGAEGISLKCCRAVHIMESYWNNVRLDQVKGRAIRICSHTDLPYAERTVDIYTYCSVFSEDQKRSKLDATIKANDNNETSDERVYNVSIKKDKINQELLQVMKSSAVDCGLNSADLGGELQCLYVDGPSDQYLFDPDLEVDKRITGIQFKKLIEAQQAHAIEEKEEKVSGALPVEQAIQAVSMATGKAAPASIVSKSRVPKMRVKPMEIYGKRYLLLPYPANKEKFKIYAASDDMFENQLGELELDPLTGQPSRIFLRS